MAVKSMFPSMDGQAYILIALLIDTPEKINIIRLEKAELGLAQHYTTLVEYNTASGRYAPILLKYILDKIETTCSLGIDVKLKG